MSRLLLLQPALPQFKMVERRDDQRVIDLSGGDQLRNFRNRNQPRDQILAVVEFNRMEAPAIFHDDREAGVAHEGRIA